jgi:hypothetical protein
MFGYFDLFVFLGFLAVGVYLSVLVLLEYVKKKKTKVVKNIQVHKLEKLPPERVTRFNCLKCGEYSILERKVAARFPEAMGRFQAIRREKTGLCSNCFVNFIEFEKSSLNNSISTPVGFLRLVILEKYLNDEKINVADVLNLLLNYDKDLRKGFEIFNHDDFYGTYIDMLNSANKLIKE